MNLGKVKPHTKTKKSPEVKIVSLPRPSEQAKRRRERDGIKRDGILVENWPRRVPAEVEK